MVVEHVLLFSVRVFPGPAIQKWFLPLVVRIRRTSPAGYTKVQMTKLSKLQLDALLEALGSDTEQASARYLKLRKNLADFFLWNRSDRPQEDADEAMDRLARRIGAGEPVVNLASYAQKIARLVLLESKARSQREGAIKEFPVIPFADRSPNDEGPKTLDCLEPCLKKLPPESTALIVEYYSGRGMALIEARKRMALRLGVSMNTLRNRALRLRRELEDCIARCAKEAE
jgi:DNA-directed RNA polymerase specialized sigma24 family protein